MLTKAIPILRHYLPKLTIVDMHVLQQRVSLFYPYFLCVTRIKIKSPVWGGGFSWPAIVSLGFFFHSTP